MKYFFKMLIGLTLFAVALFGYVAFYQYGLETGIKLSENRYQAGIRHEKQRAQSFRDSIINNNTYNNGLPKSVRTEFTK